MPAKTIRKRKSGRKRDEAIEKGWLPSEGKPALPAVPIGDGITADVSAVELADRQQSDEERKGMLRKFLEQRERDRLAAEAATKAAEQRQHNEPLERLAKRLGTTARELARRIPADTLRRLDHAVIEQELPDGTIRYKHDPVSAATRGEQPGKLAGDLLTERRRAEQKERLKRAGSPGPRPIPVATGLKSV
jgi:hypothetical protein